MYNLFFLHRCVYVNLYNYICINNFLFGHMWLHMLTFVTVINIYIYMYVFMCMYTCVKCLAFVVIVCSVCFTDVQHKTLRFFQVLYMSGIVSWVSE